MTESVYTMAARFRAALLKREAHAQAEILAAYEAAWRAIETTLAQLTSQAEASPDGDASPALLLEQQRLRELERQVAEAIREVASTAADVTLREQAALVSAAQSHAGALLQSVPRARSAVVIETAFNRLPADVIEQLVGFASDGSPVREVFGSLASDLGLETGERIKRALIQGVTLGRSPTQIARRVRREAEARGDNPMRAPAVVRRLNTVVRSETFRAYNEAARATYEANPRVVAGYRWVAALTPSTCIVCWAMHGKIFPVARPRYTHLNCRCTTVPVLKDRKGGQFETGEEKFANLEPGYQRELLGDKTFDLYAEGKILLADVVGERDHPRWGKSLYRRGYDELAGKADAKS